jgi:hypothetical protein
VLVGLVAAWSLQYWDVLCGRQQYVDSSRPLLDTAQQVTQEVVFLLQSKIFKMWKHEIKGCDVACVVLVGLVAAWSLLWQYWDVLCGRQQYEDSSTPLLDTAEQVTGWMLSTLSWASQRAFWVSG